MTGIVVLSGGVGGARFTRALRAELSRRHGSADLRPPEVTVIVNTGDDFWLHGLRVCPDLDTMMYTLGQVIDEGQGWGRDQDTQSVSAELTQWGGQWPWFTLGDKDIALHILRTHLLRTGSTLTEATTAAYGRWAEGGGFPVRILPMTDDEVETHVRLREPADEHPAQALLHLQEWWVRYRAQPEISDIEYLGATESKPAPGVIEAIGDADLVLLAPSNPVVSIGTVLAVPGIRSAIRGSRGRVIGVSPIIGGRPVRGMASECLRASGRESTAAAVAGLYGARTQGGLLDGWMIDTSDADLAEEIRSTGIEPHARPLLMDTPANAMSLSGAAVDLGLALAGHPPPGVPTRGH